MRTISLKIPESMERTLTDLARRRRASRSAILREAVERLANERPSSAAELAGELMGSLRGPRDLSTSRARMRGYGR